MLSIYPSARARGLTLASALAGYLNMGILLTLLLKNKRYHPQSGWLKYLLQLTLANAGMGFYLWHHAYSLAYWLDKGPLLRLMHLGLEVSIAIGVYVVGLALVGLRPAHFRGRLA